jgi:hypothetical protein
MSDLAGDDGDAALAGLDVGRTDSKVLLLASDIA